MKILKALLPVAGLLLAPAAAQAQEYPTKNVTMVIPFTPAGSNDTIGRYLAENLGKLWKQTVVIENRPGAGSAIGSAHVAKARPDGYTLLFVSSTFTTNAATQKNLPFDPVKDLQPVGIGALGQMVIVTGTRTPMPTLADLIKQAKSQKIFYGTTGVGSSTQFAAELFSDVAGIKMQAVHYKGGTDALVDMAGGRLDVYVGTVTQVQPSIASKTAVPVAVASKARVQALPDVPTVAEAGAPGAETDFWWGVFTAAKTPKAVVAKINESINAVMATPESAEFLAKQGAIPAQMNVDEFTKHVASELAKWQELAKTHNIVAN